MSAERTGQDVIARVLAGPLPLHDSPDEHAARIIDALHLEHYRIVPTQQDHGSHVVTSVDIPAELWEKVGDQEPEHKLLATISVCGLLMHVEAIEVIPDEVQQIATGQTEEIYLAGMFAAAGDDEPWQTTTIGGREYVILATPYC